MSTARAFIDFWVENSVHAAEQFHTPGASQDVAYLTARCIEAAKGQDLSEADLQGEIGDVTAFIRDKLKSANAAAISRRKPN